MFVLLVHGSRDRRWRDSVENLAESLRRDLQRDDPERPGVGLAYLQFATPTLVDVVSKAVRAGEQRIRVLPLFLTGEGHVHRDIGPLMDRLHAAYPTIDLKLLPPVGRYPQFVGLLRTIATAENGQPASSEADAVDRPDDPGADRGS